VFEYPGTYSAQFKATLAGRLHAAIAELKEAKPVAFIGPEGQLVGFNQTRPRDVYWTPLYVAPVAPVEQPVAEVSIGTDGKVGIVQIGTLSDG